jgi:hypothetical protein
MPLQTWGIKHNDQEATDATISTNEQDNQASGDERDADAAKRGAEHKSGEIFGKTTSMPEFPHVYFIFVFLTMM